MHSDVFNLLPDISGGFLGAAGVAIAVHPSALDTIRTNKRLTRLVAILLFGIGAAGLYSSFVQRRDARHQQEQAQQERQAYNQSIAQIKADVQKILAESDRKYDALIASSHSGAERAEAENAKGWFGNALIHFFDVRLPGAKADPSLPCKSDATRPFRCMSDAEFGHLLLTEAEKLQSAALSYEQKPQTMSMREEFSIKIENCCLRDIGDMRSTVFDRLGPTGQSQAEQAAWHNIVFYKDNSMKTLSPEQVRDYAHNLELWGQTFAKNASNQ